MFLPEKSLARRAVALVPRSRIAARLLFGIDFERAAPEDYYFDVSTIVLFRRAARVLGREARVLDMGTGSMAVLALALWKRLGCRVVASDLNPELAELARRNVRRNAAPVPVVVSRYFDEVPEDVDTVLFNPPYVRTDTGERRRLSTLRRSQWDGGASGMEVIRGYLAALEELGRPVTTLMAMNHRHVPSSAVRGLVREFPHVSLVGTYRHPVLPVAVHTLASGPPPAGGDA